MLWRKGYETRVIEGADVPNLPIVNLLDERIEGGRFALALSFSAQAVQQREVWRRLFEAELELQAYVGVVAPTDVLETLKSITPPSRWANTVVIVDSNCLWRKLIEPDDEDRAFALIQSDGRAELIMVGPPTEDAWERFLIQSQAV